MWKPRTEEPWFLGILWLNVVPISVFPCVVYVIHPSLKNCKKWQLEGSGIRGKCPVLHSLPLCILWEGCSTATVYQWNASTMPCIIPFPSRFVWILVTQCKVTLKVLLERIWNQLKDLTLDGSMRTFPWRVNWGKKTLPWDKQHYPMG